MSEESFQLSEEVFIPKEQAKLLCDPAAGGYCAFEDGYEIKMKVGQ